MSRSVSALVLGALIALVGAAVLADASYAVGIILLAIGGVFVQAGVIGLGVRMGLHDFHEPAAAAAQEQPSV